jgi:hypothetical protein
MLSPPSPGLAPPKNILSAAEIGDLCEALGRNFQTGCSLGFLEDQPWKHHVYSVTQAESEVRKSESLEKIISRKNIPTKQR